jgi:hypothetical protein
MAAICGAAGLLAWPTLPALAIVAGLYGIFAITGAISEWNSFDVGPSIQREAGAHYGQHCYSALLVLLVLHAAGLVIRARIKRSARRRNEDALRR